MSLKIKVYNQAAEPVKDLALEPKIFAVEPNLELLHQALVTQTANSRQVLAHTKDRSEVSGGGRKPWKQRNWSRSSWLKSFTDLDWWWRYFWSSQ